CEQLEAPIKTFQLSPVFDVRIPFGVKITNARYVLESLRTHRARIHSQSATDCARDSLHPFESAEICGTRGVSYLPQFYACACGDFAPIEFDFFEIAAPGVNDPPADAAVANEKIRTSPDNEQRQVFIAAKANQFRKGPFGPRLDPKLGGTANAQRGMVLQWFVKADLALFAHKS